MRVLFSTVSPAHYMAPPLLGDEQVVCGPEWTDRNDEDGRFVSLKTPVGEYDLAHIASRLSPEQQPDVVACLVDSSWRNLPRNLGAFKCPTVLLMGDTGHMHSPLANMLRYCAAEPFTRRVLVYDRQHACIFHAAGFRALHWFPGITFPHEDAAVRAARQEQRAPILAFTGQLGKFHPRRCRLAEALNAAKLPLLAKSFCQADALKFYGAAQIGFNAGLNCGINLRVFEILAGGAALLTDRIAPSGGLDALLADGREMVTYGSPEELLERARELLAHPGKTRAVANAGAAWFDGRFTATRRRAAFQALAFDGRDLPEFAFSPAERGRVLFGGNVRGLLKAVKAYEPVQELHRTHETVRVALAAGVPSDFQTLVATLPRAVVQPEPAGADMVVTAEMVNAAEPVATASAA